MWVAGKNRRHGARPGLLAHGTAIVVWFALWAPPTCAAAQSVSGTVTDRSGAVIPSAQVVLNIEGTALQQTTGTSGGFSFSQVAATAGDITVSAVGFST